MSTSKDVLKEHRNASSPLTESAKERPATSETSSPSDATPTQPGPTSAEAHAFLTSLLDRPLRVTLKDDRTVIGRLYVIDGGGNMVLCEAEEFPADLADLFEVDRARNELLSRLASSSEWEILEMREEKVQAEMKDRWEKWGQWLPRSEPFGGPGTGWGGRGLGLVLAKLGDVTRIELLDEGDDRRLEG